MKNLEEEIEKIDLLTKERDKLKDIYEDSKVYIGQLKEKIEHLKSKPQSTESRTSDNDYSNLKIEYKILKHELKIMNMKLTLRNDPSKVESDLRTENADLRASLAKKTFAFETLKEDHEELHTYNTIVKGELTQRKKQLEKLYSSKEKLYDSIAFGYLINMSAKKLKTG